MAKRETDYLTVAMAGERYPAIGERYFRRLISERRIPVHRLGRKVLLHTDDIEALLAEVREEPFGKEKRRRSDPAPRPLYVVPSPLSARQAQRHGTG